MIRRLLLWLSARLPVKVIGRDAPFVEWYYLGTPFGLFRVQIHRFLRSDPDGLHDHPWGWARTFILSGWYLEERRDATRVRSAGATYALTGDTFHRVVLPEGSREVWTLFIHGPYVKHWGFLQPFGMGDGNLEPGWRSRKGRPLALLRAPAARSPLRELAPESAEGARDPAAANQGRHPMTFWLGVLVGFALMWLMIGLALTAWLIWSLKRIASAAVLSLALSGCAGTSLVVGAWSYHEDRDKPYNESNSIIALQIPINEEWRAVGGRYKNSYNLPSRFAAAMWLPVCKGNWRFGGMAGAVDGYDPENRSKREPLATPVLTYERRNWGVDFMPFNGDVLTLLFKLRF